MIATLALLAALPAGAGPALRAFALSPKVIESKVYGSWYETKDKVVAGVPWPRHTHEPFGWRFGRDDAVTWELGGELSTGPYLGGVKIDTSVTPWRLDIHSRNDKGTVSVMPGIFGFEDDALVWVTEYPGDGWCRLDPAGKYQDRPTGFTSTKDNRYARMVLRPCEYLQTEFPPPVAKK